MECKAGWGVLDLSPEVVWAMVWEAARAECPEAVWAACLEAVWAVCLEVTWVACLEVVWEELQVAERTTRPWLCAHPTSFPR